MSHVAPGIGTDRADVADGGMAPRSIVETFDVGEDVASGVLPCCIVLVMDELGLERVEETLHRGIVVAIGLAAHGGLEAGGLQRIAILRRSILNAASEWWIRPEPGRCTEMAMRRAPAAARCANDPPSPSRRSCGCTNP